jgi:predicted SAM-dependent methyltransferase
MSETAHGREYLAPYCEGLGLDIGFGGDAIVPHAITMDAHTPYTQVGGDKQILRGHCEDLSGFCDESLDFIYSSHLLEDFSYIHLRRILTEWRRVLKVGGRVITNCPNQKTFLAHCSRTGQGVNDAHHEPDFSIENFEEKVLGPTGPWETVFRMPEAHNYSWYLVVEKV